MFDMKQHLLERHVQFERYTSLSWNDEEATASFILYNLSNQICGYQSYRPLFGKQRKNDEKYGRYYTRTHDEGWTHCIALWGMETFYYRSDILFITEGIFDAVRIHNENLPCLAALSNDPKILRSWLPLLGRRIITVCDGDKAGLKLRNIGHDSIICPQNRDLGKLSTKECQDLLRIVT